MFVSCFLLVAVFLLDLVLLPIMVGTNMSEFENLGFLSKMFSSGIHTDFDAEWYPDVGTIILVNMIVFIFQPLIDFLIEWVIMKIEHWYRKKQV